MRWLNRDRWRRPPIGAVWGGMQTVAARNADAALLPGGALVLSPHQDDETIGCGLLMAEKAIRGFPVAVAVATDGRRGWYASMRRPSPDDIADIRRSEWHRALDLLSVRREDRFELGFPDGELSDHEGELAGRIADLILRVRPSQVFVTKSSDPHPDHRILEHAARGAVTRIYSSDPPDPDAWGSDGSGGRDLGPRPQMFTYRVYPGEGLWPEGRPSHISAHTALAHIVHSAVGLTGRRALLLRARGSMAVKAAAIGAYDSQRKLLNGELRYVWGKGSELYWVVGEEELEGRWGSSDSLN